MCEQQGLDPNTILSKEFDYAAQTAFQAHEDRVRVFSYYLATIATIAASLVVTDLAGNMYLVLLALVFAVLTIVGLLSLLKLIKLRLAWTDSVRAMCQIKYYYIQSCKDAGLEKAFRWSTRTIPSPGKKWSVAFLMMVTMALLSSLSAGGAILFFALSAGGDYQSMISIVVFLLFFGGQIGLWFYLTRSTKAAADSGFAARERGRDLQSE